MPIKPHSVLGRLFHQGVLARWKAATAVTGQTRRGILRVQRHQARQLKSVLHEFCHRADDRLALPHIRSVNFPKPIGTDWSWRPAIWRLRLDQPGRAPVADRTWLDDDISIFHDCPHDEIAIRQVRNLGDDDIAPFRLSMEVFHFTGSYLSIVIDLPKESCHVLKKQHLLQLGAFIETETPIAISARLNIKNGPNTEQILLTLSHGSAMATVEFDLAYTQLNEKRAEKMWIDLMFETPQMNRITLRDLTLCRYPRAQI
ncbi:MAG: hypothetical protein II336_08125 [Loktanella sp.]|nr:hypothetical protein [Loktanella sp.]